MARGPVFISLFSVISRSKKRLFQYIVLNFIHFSHLPCFLILVFAFKIMIGRFWITDNMASNVNKVKVDAL